MYNILVAQGKRGRKAGMAAETIDVHVHFGSPSDAASGCYWSKKFEQTAAYAAMLMLTRSLFKRISFSTVKRHLMDVIHGSALVDKVALLALDQVYDREGKVHPNRTHLHVPNRCIADMAAENPKILFGASVHPNRSDWKEELDFSLEHGAVLCKWIPSSQQIDPLDSNCRNFYKKLADHRLPLLCHGGPEYSIPTSLSQSTAHRFNNPARLRKALEEGVTVIVAHCALPYFWFFDADYQDHFKAFLRLFNEADSRGWNLFADLSALTGFFRLPYIRDEIIRLPHQRLLLGSDYPIPLSELSYHRRTGFFSRLRFLFKLMRLKNPLDKNVMLIREMGFDACVFTNAQRLFSSIRRTIP
jgi:predicted TIM-barrel fold metal-dependent hydrolase